MSSKTILPAVALFGGGEVAEGFLRQLLRLRDLGQCRIAGVAPTALAEGDRTVLATLCANNDVPIFASPLESLETPLDVAFSAGNPYLFPSELLTHPVHGVINFHAAPLPRYRGSATPAFAILEGCKEFGVTFHLAHQALDAGPIVFQKEFAIAADDTSRDVDRRCIAKGIAAFEALAADMLVGNFTPRPNVVERPPYRRSEIQPYRRLDQSWTTQKLWDHIRACDWPGVLKPAYMEIAGHPVYLTKSVRGTWLPGAGSEQEP